MSKSIEEWLPEKIYQGEDQQGYEEFQYYNQALTEASKVEIGLDRDVMVTILTLLIGYEPGAINMIVDKLIAAEDDLIVRKEGR